MKRSPLASSHRHADSPPKPGKREVSTSPLRYSSAPKRVRWGSRGSKAAIGRALTSIATGAATENSSGRVRFGGGCARAPGIAIAESPAADDSRKRRRVMGTRMLLRMQPAPMAGCGGGHPLGLPEQIGELFCDGAAEPFRVHDGGGAAGVAPCRRGQG